MISLSFLLCASVSLWFLASPGSLRADDTQTADETTLRSAGFATDGPALLDFFRKRTLSDAGQAELLQTIRLLGDSQFGVRQRASRDLVARGRCARRFLQDAMRDPDLEIALRAERCLIELENGSAVSQELAAARLLAARKPEGTARVVLDYLPFADDELIEEELLAALGSAGLRDGKAETILLEALQDKLPVKRSAAAMIVGRSSQAEQRGKVRPLLKDRDLRVRLRAVQGLVAAHEKDAIATLLPLLSEAPHEIAWQAEELLCKLAGEQAPQVSVSTGSPAERGKCREAWEAWWRAQESKLDLAKIDLEDRVLGLTLIVAFDGYTGGQGKVWEMRSDGKPRWEITNVQGPIDARMLPGNRVLIAEHNARKVTERDLQGKILWEYAAPNNQYPVACQRLPNGNTFIATYNQVLEVTPDHKQVYSYPCRQGIIYAAQKLRNGQIVTVTSNGALVVIDDKGKEVRTVQVGAVVGWMTVEALPGGHFLVPHAQTNKVLELDSEGRTVATVQAAGANAASKMRNGNVLICQHNGRKVVEVDRSGKVVWEQTLEGRPFWSRRR